MAPQGPPLHAVPRESGGPQIPQRMRAMCCIKQFTCASPIPTGVLQLDFNFVAVGFAFSHGEASAPQGLLLCPPADAHDSGLATSC